MEIRNIAIIAHVDHGKTTITDAIMRQAGMFTTGMSMDTDKIEQERGITIYSKNTSLFYPNPADGHSKTTKINIVDTPGHADFGSEVERVLRSVDSVLLVVDAQEGPMPQTRFVLKKSLQLGLKPIVVINKIDKPAANPQQAQEDVYELFLELGANDEQLDFTTVYSIGRDGVAKRKLEDDFKDLTPLLDVILEEVTPLDVNLDAPAKVQVFNLGYDNFLGRMAICRIYDGKLNDNDPVFVKKSTGETRKGKLTKLFTFKGVAREETKVVEAGDIIMLAGLPNVFIGETITTDENIEPMPAIKVDEPTITLDFLVNNSPFAGREGKYVTGRQIRERLEKELEVNVGLEVDFSEGQMKVAGRGELHIAVLLENMRREGYELQVSQPRIIEKEENGVKLEPYEEVTIDIPTQFQGVVIEKLGQRKGALSDMKQNENTSRLIFKIPTRGLLGYRSQFVVDTRGEGIISSRMVGFEKFAGEIYKRTTGSMTSMANGKALGFSLYNLQDRGELYIGANTQVYEGMVIGNTSKGEEMPVNPTKGKQLTNMRSSSSDENIMLVPHKELSIEAGLEIMSEDEYLEITPTSVRLRKQHLTEIDRSRAKRK